MMKPYAFGRISPILCTVTFLVICVFFPIHHAAASFRDGLVSHWTFDGKDTVWSGVGAGTVRDISGSGNTATFVDMRQATATVPGKIGQGIRFNSAHSQQANVTATTPYTGTTLTLSLWVKRADALNTQQAFYTSDIGYLFSNNRPCMEDFSGDRMSRPSLCGMNTYTDSFWHHFVFVADGTTLFVYTDGNLSTSTPGSILSSGQKNTGVIGSSNSRWFNGSLDDVRIYSRALTATDVQQLYKLGGAKAGASPKVIGNPTRSNGLVGYWTFDGKDTVWTSATLGTTTDTSGNGHYAGFINMNRDVNVVPGKIGQGVQLNVQGATTSSVSIAPQIAISDWDNHAVSFWMKPTQIGTALLVGNSNGNGVQLAGNIVILNTYNASCPTVTANVWSFITASVSNGTATIYKDGMPYCSTSPGSNNPYIIMGNDIFGDKYFGALDDVRIYSRPLSAAEIQQLYKQGATKLGVTPTRTASSTGLSSGLVGHWTFDGKDTTWSGATTGTTRDTSGNGNTGTLTNLTRASSVRAGKIGQGIDFTGTGAQKIDIGSPTSLDNIEAQGGGGMTISAWIYPRTSGEVTEGTILNKGNVADTSNGAWSFKFSGSGVNRLLFEKSYGTTALFRQTVSNTLTLNKWQYVTVTWDGSSSASNIHLYINGVEATYQTSTDGVGSKISDAANSISINDGVGSREFDGTIDDIRIYSRILSATEIQQLYKLGQSRAR